jgi:peptide/nickel transport system permease protein
MNKPVAIPVEPDLPERSQPLARFIRRYFRSRSAVLGSGVLFLVVLTAIFAPLISPYDPVLISTADRMQPPSNIHLFGTDDFGRDVLTRVFYGGRLSLLVGLTSVALASVSGTLLGIVAGYYGRWIDALIMRMIDVMLAFPSILLALVIVAILGRGLFNVMLAVGISTIPLYTRIVRGTTLSVKEMDYVVAAQATGSRDWRIMLFHILPNILAPIIVITTNGVAGAIISGAALSFLGLGAQPPTSEWGIMLAEGRGYLRAAAWITTFPGLAIMVTVMAINLLGDGLRDILDPRLKVE